MVHREGVGLYYMIFSLLSLFFTNLVHKLVARAKPHQHWYQLP
jgi:hypothetical protein